ncbi:MAG TPA: formimidoylglutamase [Acidobacteriota bacterium]|nr:formimidoylglutamase [Acidobacteriota bacterium]
MDERPRTEAAGTDERGRRAAEPWSGRIDDPNDPLARRWHQVVEPWPLGAPLPAGLKPSFAAGAPAVCLIGFPTDEGVRRNQGRPGAAAAPGLIRRALANLPCLFDDKLRLLDLGDVTTVGGNLEGAHEELARLVAEVVAAGGFPIVLGGGHDVALAHFEGLRRGLGVPPRIVNFDAHFDLRPCDPAVGVHSGNSFSRAAALCKERGEPFRYHVIGVQQSANTRSLFRVAEELGAEWFMARDVEGDGAAAVAARIDAWGADEAPIQATLCCDVLGAAHAPGVSAPQPFGLAPETVLEAMRRLARGGRAAGLDVAEVSPRFDEDNRTAKLAAVLIYAWVNALAGVGFEPR